MRKVKCWARAPDGRSMVSTRTGQLNGLWSALCLTAMMACVGKASGNDPRVGARALPDLW